MEATVATQIPVAIPRLTHNGNLILPPMRYKLIKK